VKAISVKEPWASKIMFGEKTIETRTWKTNYRGEILICASANPKSDYSGKALAIASIVECRPMVKADEKKACCPIYPGAYAWLLSDVKRIEGFPVKGRLGIFDVEMMR
jgi:hypothetical protein